MINGHWNLEESLSYVLLGCSLGIICCRKNRQGKGKECIFIKQGVGIKSIDVKPLFY